MQIIPNKFLKLSSLNGNNAIPSLLPISIINDSSLLRLNFFKYLKAASLKWFLKVSVVDERYKYSIALMFSYINLCKPNKNKLNISDLSFNLEYNCWENNVRPIDVIKDLNNKKYKDEVERIKNANIKYPIIYSKI